MHGEDIGVVQGRGGLGLLLKTPQAVGVLRDEGRQNLDRDLALQAQIAGAIDLAHAACTQQAEHLITIQFGACSQPHGEPDYKLRTSLGLRFGYCSAGVRA